MVECVPNFAEGRDSRTILALVQSMRLPEVRLLDLTIDPSANRTVVTIAGPPTAVGEAAIRAAGVAASRIDLTRHLGTHPRIGAADVIPFAPLEGSSLGACALLARETAEALWSRYRLPSYLYAAAASRPDRVDLDEVRRGQFEQLREAVLRDASRRPDTGGPGLHPTAGACAVGARPVLIEYRVLLDTGDVRIARAVARELREQVSGLAGLRVLPLLVEKTAQLAVLLMGWQEISPNALHAAIVNSAQRYKAQTAGIRLVGLIPEAACQPGSAWAGQLLGFDPSRNLLERRIQSPIPWPETLPR